MTANEDKPVDREAWRRLLEGDGEGPSELTDARIRAKARQSIAPRTGRWWLPASLAASLLLAVLLVQRQYDRPAAPAIIAESDYAVAPAAAPAPTRGDGPATDSASLDAPPAPMAERSVAKASDEREEEFRELAPSPPVVPPPMIDLPTVAESRVASAAAEKPASAPAAGAALANAAPAEAAPAAQAKREKEVGEIVVTGSRVRESDQESTTPVTQVTAADVTSPSQGVTGALVKSTDIERTPEQWYAEIEKLRAAGKKRAAKRELEKLEAAHPGWLEEHLKQEPPKQ